MFYDIERRGNTRDIYTVLLRFVRSKPSHWWEVFAVYQCHGYGGVVKHSHWLTASTYLIKYLSTNPLKIQEFKFN